MEECDQSCKKCLTPMLEIEKPSFFTCGCIICTLCIDKDESCPDHNSQLSDQVTQDPTIKQLLQEAKLLGRQYERTRGVSRTTFDAKVREIQRSVKALVGNGSSGNQMGIQQPVYDLVQAHYSPVPSTHYANPGISELASVSNMCPHCRIPIQGTRCDCGYVNLDAVPHPAPEAPAAVQRPNGQNEVSSWVCVYPNCRYNNVLWNNGICASCYRSCNRTEPQPVPVVQPTSTDGMGPHSVWKCTSCGYEYNMRDTSTCLHCSARKPVPTPAKTEPRKDNPPPTEEGVWKCTNCGYEYNLRDTSTCYHCHAKKPVPTPAKNEPRKDNPPPAEAGAWKCGCNRWKQANLQQCLICGKSNPNNPKTSASTPVESKRNNRVCPSKLTLCSKCQQALGDNHVCRGRR